MTPHLIRLWCRWTGRRHLLRLYNGILGTGRPGSAMLPSELIDQALGLLLSGLGNTLAIHSNRNWVWPYWVERQQNPKDPGFIPTGVNVVTTNLSHRNWTTMGLKGSRRESMVDPVGMLTPRPFEWSLLSFLEESGQRVFPSKLVDEVEQALLHGQERTGVITRYRVFKGLEWEVEAMPQGEPGREWVWFRIRVRNHGPARRHVNVGLAIRPYNMLTMGPIHHLQFEDEVWVVNHRPSLRLFWKPDRVQVSDRQGGDPLISEKGSGARLMASRSGILSGVAEKKLELEPGESVELASMLSMDGGLPKGVEELKSPWEMVAPQDQKTCAIHWPVDLLNEAFEGIRSRLHVFDDVDVYTPGSFFYHEHWIRDSAFLMMADLNLGRFDHIEKKLRYWYSHQSTKGFFSSQKGEWDSTGQVLVMTVMASRRMHRPEILETYSEQILRAVRWLFRVRQSRQAGHGVHQGLLPAGLSAEHFGPNDHYFWDNFWSLAGIQAVLSHPTLKVLAEQGLWENFELYMGDVCRAMDYGIAHRGEGALPCAPTRGFDAAAIGNLIAISPLEIFGVDAPWVAPTVKGLLRDHVIDDMFYQSIIHTGYNPYLTLQLARVMMEMNDPSYAKLLSAVLKRGGKTWAWPEAIHPISGGGCMGDGDHGWVLAELVNILRDGVVDQKKDGTIFLGRGLCADWFKQTGALRATSLPLDGGRLDVSLNKNTEGWSWVWNFSPHEEGESFQMMLLEPMGAGERRQKMVTINSGMWTWT